jgi:hypothetical protein
MKKIINCPKCHNLLVNYMDNFWDCFKYNDHRFLSTTKTNSNELTQIQISFDLNNLDAFVVWNFVPKELSIFSNKDNVYGISIPYFDPEPFINDYDKLINKIKLYMLFS